MKTNEENKCIWMTAGVVNYKLCPYNYACNMCGFDQAMRNAGRETAPQKRKVPWPERLRKLGGPEKYCRHMLQGLVSYKLCPMNYDCGSCKYDQMVQDTIGDAALPKLRQIAGFKIAPTYHFHRKHAWATVEYGGKCRVGFDDFAGKLLGEQREYVLPRIGQKVAQNEPFMRVKTADRVYELESPVDGTVMAVNPLQDRPAELEPFSDGWVAFVEPTPRMPANMKKLMYGEKAMEWLTDRSDRLIQTLQPGAPLAADGGVIAADVFTALDAQKRADLIENILLAD